MPLVLKKTIYVLTAGTLSAFRLVSYTIPKKRG
nr:MAG TPA_asm: hypothetical protein [Caudoviricetes sp.]